MSDKKQQILTGFTEEQLEKIREYQFSKKINSRSEAIRELIDQALKTALK